MTNKYSSSRSNSTAIKCSTCGRWSSPLKGCKYCHGFSAANLTPADVIGNNFGSSPRFRPDSDLETEYQARLNRVQAPSITRIKIPSPKHGHHVGISCVGDVHIGTDACAFDAFKTLLAYVENHDNEYLTIQGDLVDFLTGVSVGIMAEQSMVAKDQMYLALKLLRPLAKKRKILWSLRGNHEERFDKATRNIMDPAEQMAKQLDIQYLESAGYTVIDCSSASYISYNLHGFPVGNKPAARRNKMESFLTHINADVVTCGHNHQLDVIQMVSQRLDNSTMKPMVRYQYGIFTGTYHIFHGYPVEQGLLPGPLGCARIEFDIKHNIVLPRILPVVQVNGKYIQTLPK